MSRTTLCVSTAALLTAASVSLMVARHHVLGDEVYRPAGPNTWKVTLSAQGVSLAGARMSTAIPLELDRQQVLDDLYDSDRLAHKAPDARHPERRVVLWAQRDNVPPGPFRARCEFHVAVDATGRSGHAPGGLYAPPRPGEHLESPPATDGTKLAAAARLIVAELGNTASPRDIAEALYRFVQGEVKNEPYTDGPPVSAALCLEKGRGDRLAKARLLQALLRTRGLPARLVAGVTLGRGEEQPAHYWVEAWVDGHWLPMCPFHGYFGKVPPTYLVFGLGDRPLVQGRHIKDLDYAFLVERAAPAAPAPDEASLGRRLFTTFSLVLLPPAERRLVELLLLLPVAALIICVFRNLIGLSSFGTFAPALIGLAFHDLHSLPGILVFVSILLVGWMLRRVLDWYHLLQVPRVAVMLTLIMIVLIACIVVSSRYGAGVTRYVALFPIVILTGMVERFWTLETEDCTLASFRTLFQTLLIATGIAVVLSSQWLARHLFRYPEALGLVMAGQLLIGRYTGYRLMELFRFRDFLRPPAPPVGYTAAID